MSTVSPRAGTLTWAGLAVVLTAAAVLSFAALRELAAAVGIPAVLAWLMPVAVDAGAAVSCATWLSRRVPADASRFAARMTCTLLALTVVGNAAQLGMHAHGVTPPWWCSVAVGAIPPAVVGATVHLLVLLARATADPAAEIPAAEPAVTPASVDVQRVPAQEAPAKVRAERPRPVPTRAAATADASSDDEVAARRRAKDAKRKRDARAAARKTASHG